MKRRANRLEAFKKPYYLLAITEVDKIAPNDHESLIEFIKLAAQSQVQQLEIKTTEGVFIQIAPFLESVQGVLRISEEEAHLEGFLMTSNDLKAVIESSCHLDTLKLMNCRWINQEDEKFSLTLDPSLEFRFETLFLSGSFPTRPCICKFCDSLPSETDITEVEPNCSHQILKLIASELASTNAKTTINEVRVDENDLNVDVVLQVFVDHGMEVTVEHW